jgi:hypothetical protein
MMNPVGQLQLSRGRTIKRWANSPVHTSFESAGFCLSRRIINPGSFHSAIWQYWHWKAGETSPWFTNCKHGKKTTKIDVGSDRISFISPFAKKRITPPVWTNDRRARVLLQYEAPHYQGVVERLEIRVAVGEAGVSASGVER